MKPIDWIAILGALAWTPHLFSAIRKLVTKPEVRIITPRTAELGFTTLGAIFNLHLAFSVRNRDLVVTALKIKLQHESGEEKLFEWQGIQQQFMKMRAPDGSVMPYEKDQSVLAMKLNENDIQERFIQFQETSFHVEKYDYESKIVKKIIYLKSQGKYNPQEFMNSQEMQEVINYVKHSFSWKAGVYTVIAEVESPESFNLVDNKYEFTLTPVDIEELEKNKNEIDQDYKYQMVQQEENEYKKVTWNWRNPGLRKLKN